MKNSVAVLLAGGKGTRMKSDLPKVLHKIGNKEMIFYSIGNLKKAGFEKIVLLVGFMADEIKKVVGNTIDYAYQPEPLGTGDAAFHAVSSLGENVANVLIVNGDDSAFYNPDSLSRIYQQHLKQRAAVTFAVTELENPTGMGRVVRENEGKVKKIVEEKEADEKERQIREINIGLYVFECAWLKENAPTRSNAGMLKFRN